MCLAAVVWRFLPFIQPVITHDMCDTEPVVAKYAVSPQRLRCAMGRKIAPLPDSSFVPPERQRQEFLRIDKALESFNGKKKAVNIIEIGAEGCRQIKIMLLFSLGGPYFEYDRYHGRISFEWGADARRRKSRSSRRMNCSFLANS